MVIWMGIYFHCQKLDEIRWIIERNRQEQWDFIYFLLQGASADGVPATPTVPHLRLWVWYPPTQLLEGEKEDFPVAALYDGKVLWTLPNFFLQRNHGNSKCNPLKDGWIMYCYGINSCSVLLHLRQRNSGPMQGLRRRTQTAPMQSKPVASGKRRTQEFWCWLARICRKKAWLHTLRTTPRRASGVFDPSGPWQDKPFGHIWARCTKFIQIPTQNPSVCIAQIQHHRSLITGPKMNQYHTNPLLNQGKFMLGRDLSVQHSWMLNGDFCESPQWLPTPVTAAWRTSSAWLALSLEGGGLPKRRDSGLIHLSTYLYRPIPSYTILCLSLPIYPHISIQFHASIHLSRYTVTCISLYLKNVFRGTERKQRTTQKHIENHHWELLQTRVTALLPSLLHFSLETPPEAPHDAAAALSLFICKVWRLSGWCIDTKGSGSTAEKGEAGNAGPVALRSWCWRFSDALSCVGIHALCKSREIKARQSAMNAVRLPGRIKQMTHQSHDPVKCIPSNWFGMVLASTSLLHQGDLQQPSEDPGLWSSAHSMQDLSTLVQSEGSKGNLNPLANIHHHPIWPIWPIWNPPMSTWLTMIWWLQIRGCKYV